MTSKHYKWQTSWVVDLGAATATHSGGLVVRFVAGGGQAENADTILAALAAKNGPHNAPKMLQRLMREASEVYAEAQRADR